MSADFESPSSSNPYASPPVDVPDDVVPVTSERLQVNLRLIVWAAIAGTVTNVAVKAWGGFRTHLLEPAVLSTYVSVALVGAAGGVGAALLFHALRDKQFRRLMPGHWLLIGYLLDIVGSLLYVMIEFTELRYNRTEILIVISLIGAALFGAFLWHTDETRLWKYFAGTRAALSFLAIGQIFAFKLNGPSFTPEFTDPDFILRILVLICTLASMLLFLIAIIQDRVRGAKRDTWHWLGLGASIAVPLLSLATTFLWRFTMMPF